jgi:hypothetical protein
MQNIIIIVIDRNAATGGSGFTDCVPVRLYTSQGPDRANFITRPQLIYSRSAWMIIIRSIFWDIKQAELPCYLLHADFFLGPFFDPEDGGDVFLCNIGRLSTDYTSLYPRSKNFINTAVRTSHPI